MYHPTSRVLTVLELLQSRPFITGPELAARLEMDIRTVRRYITHLQDVGIPVEGTVGRYGGYRLRPGFKLPPLMLTEAEATAILLGLLGTSWLEIGQPALAVEGALAKITRVLPAQARDRLNSLAAHLFVFSPLQDARPDAALLLNLCEAIGQSQRVTLDYRAHDDTLTHRVVEPYGIVGWQGHWYVVGYCCLRHDHRTFRLDRIQGVEVLTEHFERADDFDCRAYIIKRYAGAASGMRIAVEFFAPLAVVQRNIPDSYGDLSATATGVLLDTRYEDVEDFARYLIGLNLPFVVLRPPELRDALLRLADQIVRSATAQPHPSGAGVAAEPTSGDVSTTQRTL